MNTQTGKVLNVWMNQGIAEWQVWKTKQGVSSFMEEDKKRILEKQNHVANRKGLHSLRL